MDRTDVVPLLQGFGQSGSDPGNAGILFVEDVVGLISPRIGWNGAVRFSRMRVNDEDEGFVAPRSASRIQTAVVRSGSSFGKSDALLLIIPRRRFLLRCPPFPRLVFPRLLFPRLRFP